MSGAEKITGVVAGTAIRFRVDPPAAAAALSRMLEEVAAETHSLEVRGILGAIATSDATLEEQVTALGFVLRGLRGRGQFRHTVMAQRLDVLRHLARGALRDGYREVVVPGGGERGRDLIAGRLRFRAGRGWVGEATGGKGAGGEVGPCDSVDQVAEIVAAIACGQALAIDTARVAAGGRA